MLTDAAVNIDTAPLGGYEEDGDMEDGEEEDEDGEEEGEEDEVQEIAEEVFEATPAKGKSVRTMNYTEVEDGILIKAWESVSLDSVTGTDQTGKRYWQRIEDKFFQLMPPLSSTPTRSYRSLQGRWDIIKNACS